MSSVMIGHRSHRRVRCTACNKSMRSDNLKQHQTVHKGILLMAENQVRGEDQQSTAPREESNRKIEDIARKILQGETKSSAAAAVVATSGVVKRKFVCDGCGKGFVSAQSLWNHKNRRLKPQLASSSGGAEPLTLSWNGKSWQRCGSKNLCYRLNLGRDLSNLLERGAIKDDSLNSTQKEYIEMYKSLFLDD